MTARGVIKLLTVLCVLLALGSVCLSFALDAKMKEVRCLRDAAEEGLVANCG